MLHTQILRYLLVSQASTPPVAEDLTLSNVMFPVNKSVILIYGNPELELHGNYRIKNFLKDHRIFMMSAIAALTLNGTWIISDKDSIQTSFPNFLNILKKLGAKIN